MVLKNLPKVNHAVTCQLLFNCFVDEGIDTRVHAVKIQSSREIDFGLNRDFFTRKNMIRFPKLECYSADELYRRSLLLQRYVTCLSLCYSVLKGHARGHGYIFI